MTEHEWIEEKFHGTLFGIFTRYRCINCGGVAADVWFKGVGYPKKIKIEGSTVNLTNDCLESLKIMQTYWEKYSKKKKRLNKKKK